MTALVPADGSPPAKTTTPRPGDKLNATTALLARARDRLEKPFRDLDALFKVDCVDCWVERFPIPDLPHPGQPTARAEAWLANLSLDDLDAIHDRVAEAHDAEADRREAGACLGALLDAYPSHREARESYFATLLHDLTDEGFGPHVVAEACRTIRRSSTFAPSVGEMFAACEKARGRLRTGLRHIERVLEARTAIREAQAVFAVPLDEWSPDWWAAAIHHFRGWYPPGGAGSWDARLGPMPTEAGCRAPADLLRQWGYDRRAAA